MQAAANGSRKAHDWLSASLEATKEQSRHSGLSDSRPSSAQMRPDGRSLLSPRQEKWEDLEGDEDVFVEEDEGGSSIVDLASEDSESERREIEQALLAEQMKRDPQWGGYEMDPSRPNVLSEFEPRYTGGARREDMQIVAAVTDAALSGRDEVGGVDCAGREGKWMATLVNGCQYEGEWRGGLMHGRGTLRWPDGTTYTGDLCRARISGEGSYYYTTGVEYHGQVLDGERHGEGLMLVPRPRFARYMGSWRQGKRHGHGVLRLDEEDESFYEGEWQDDRRHGFGVMVYPNGNRYEGEWCKDKRHGQGCMHWLDLGEIYEGQWWEGYQHGSGEHVWYPSNSSPALVDGAISRMGRDGGLANSKQVMAASKLLGGKNTSSKTKQPLIISPFVTRNYYRGDWVKGLREGVGSFEYADGSRFRGGWLGNQKHGTGVFVSADGRVEEGSWEHDRKILDQAPEGLDAEVLEVPRGRAAAAEERRQKLLARFESVLHQRPDRNIVLNIDDVVASQVDPDREVRRVKNSLLQHWHELKALFASLLSARASALAPTAAAVPHSAANKGWGPAAAAYPTGGRGLPLGGGAAGILQGAGGRIWLSVDEVAGFVRKCKLLDVRLGLLVVHNVMQRVWDKERRADMACEAATPTQPASSESAKAPCVGAPSMALRVRSQKAASVEQATGSGPSAQTLASRLTALQDDADGACQQLEGARGVVLFRHFLELLVRVASMRFSEFERLSARIDYCLFHHILPLVPLEAKAAEQDDRGRQKVKGLKPSKAKSKGRSKARGASRDKTSGGSSTTSPRRRTIAKSTSRIGSPVKTQQQQMQERAEVIRQNYDGLRQVYVALARDGSRGVVLRDVCALLLSCGIIRSGGSRGASMCQGAADEGDADGEWDLDPDEWSYTRVVCKLLAVDLNLKDTDSYILENAANIDVHLSFVELTEGLLKLAQDLPYTGVREEAGDELARLLARLLADIDSKRAQEQRKQEELLAGLSLACSRTPGASDASPRGAAAGRELEGEEEENEENETWTGDGDD